MKHLLLLLGFTTLTSSLMAQKETGTVTDIEGNTYKTVKIGEQWWMAENLKVTQYADGTAIPHVTDDNDWAALGDNNTDKAYCFYNNNANLGYGALYTFAAATNGTPHSGSHIQGVCPIGWHLPSDAEWTQLKNYMIANSYNYDGTTSGNKIGKALASNTGWRNSSDVGDVGNNPATNNSSGFNALPGSTRTKSGSFDGARDYGIWWSSTQYSGDTAYDHGLFYGDPDLRRGYDDKSRGFSVRCVRE